MDKKTAESMKNRAFRVGAGNIARRYNRRRFSLDMSKYPSETAERYVKLKDCPVRDENAIYVIGGIFISDRSKLINKHTGTRESGSLAVTGYFTSDGAYHDFHKFVNVPNYLVPTLKDMLADMEVIDAINGGAFGFEIYAYQDKQYDHDCFGVNFVDIATDE